MNTQELSQLITRCLPMWRRYAAYRCRLYGIVLESDDVVGDALEVLCRQPDAMLERMLRSEMGGGSYLRGFVFKVIKRRIAYRLQNRREFVTADFLNISYEQDNGEDSFACTDEARDATACLREDSFITIEPFRKVSNVRGSISLHISRRGKVSYHAETGRRPLGRIQRRFPTRHEAFAFLVSQAEEK